MPRYTFKKSFVKLCAVTAIVTVSLAISASNSWAAEPDLVGYAKHEVACYVFAVAAGIADPQIHASRVSVQKLDARAISYVVGYQTATLDFFGKLLTEDFGSYKAARIVAAKKLYSDALCSTAVYL